MKKSLIVFVLTLTLLVGILSAPAMAYENFSCNQGNYKFGNNITAKNGYKVISVSSNDIIGVLLKYKNWYANFYNKHNQSKPEEPAPEAKPEEPAPEAKPEEPAPSPDPGTKPEEPAPSPDPEAKPEKPAPSPGPETKPEKPAPSPDPETKPEPVPVPEGVSGQQGQMLDMVNQERSKAGLKPLTWDPDLANVAQVKAKDMVDNNYFDHTSPTYGSPFEMMKKFGISYRAAGENLAGSSSVERAHVGLMNSEGHRKNILNPNFTHLGIGVEKSTRYGYVYVQMFIGK